MKRQINVKSLNKNKKEQEYNLPEYLDDNFFIRMKKEFEEYHKDYKLLSERANLIEENERIRKTYEAENSIFNFL